MMLALCIFDVILDRIESHSWLRQSVVNWLLKDLVIDGSSFTTRDGHSIAPTSCFEFLLLVDHLLPKKLRIQLSELLNLCNSINQETKKDMGNTTCQ